MLVALFPVTRKRRSRRSRSLKDRTRGSGPRAGCCGLQGPRWASPALGSDVSHTCGSIGRVAHSSMFSLSSVTLVANAGQWCLAWLHRMSQEALSHCGRQNLTFLGDFFRCTQELDSEWHLNTNSVLRAVKAQIFFMNFLHTSFLKNYSICEVWMQGK